MTTMIDAPVIKTAVPLRDAVRRHLIFLSDVRSLAPSTVKSVKMALDVLCEVAGNTLPTVQLTSEHVGATMKRLRTGDSTAVAGQRIAAGKKVRTGRTTTSLGPAIAAIRAFVRWLHAEQLLSRYVDPSDGLHRVNATGTRRERHWTLPLAQWEEALTVAERFHPRDRMVVALGLWGGRRGSDIQPMRVKHLDFDLEEWTHFNAKRGGTWHPLPMIFPELKREFMRWLGYLIKEHGELNPDWYLVPYRLSTPEFNFSGEQPGLRPDWPMDPTRETNINQFGITARRTLEVMGAPMDQRLGFHTLRRSCAVALMEDDNWNESDVSEWLDHADTKTTRIYTQNSDAMARLRTRYNDSPLQPTSPGWRPERIAPNDRKAILGALAREVGEP